MDQIYFENICAVQRKMLQDLARTKLKKTAPIKVFAVVVIAFYAAIQLIDWIMTGTIQVDHLLSLGFMIVLLIAVLNAPKIIAWLSVKKHKRVYGGELTETVARFGEKIETNNRKGEEALSYSQIVAVYCLPDCFAIEFTPKLVLLLDCNRFTGGSFAEFKQFLREKRPDLVIPE